MASHGSSGVDRVIELLTSELTNTMQLLGVTCVAELQRHHVVTPWEPGAAALRNPEAHI